MTPRIACREFLSLICPVADGREATVTRAPHLDFLCSIDIPSAEVAIPLFAAERLKATRARHLMSRLNLARAQSWPLGRPPRVCRRVGTRSRDTNASKTATTLKLAFGAMLPNNIAARHCYAYQDGRRGVDGKRVPVAARHEIALLRHVFAKAIRWGIATKNPADGLELGPRSPKRAQVTLEQVEAVKKLANDRMRVAIDLAVCTGQRRGDLLALKRDQLSGEGITFKQSKTGARVLIEWSKNLEAIIARAKAMSPQIPAEYLLRKRNGRPYTEDGFSAIWQRLMVKYANAGGVRFSFHDLRLVSADGAATPEEARDRLGHASVETTKRHYLRGATRAKPRS